MVNYRFDLLDKLKALSDNGKLDLAQYDGQTARDLGTDDFEKIHYSVSSSLQMPAAAYKLELAGRDLGDKGTHLFENSLMLAVEYINGRLRFVEGDTDGDAGGSGDAVTKRGISASPANDEDALKAVLARLDAFETTTRRMDGRLASVQKTLSDEVRKSSEAAASIADDGTTGELRIAIDMHDGETVLHDVAIILEKVTALQGTLEECAKGISANAEGSASCLNEIRSCSSSIDNLLNVLYFDDADGAGDADYDMSADDGDDGDDVGMTSVAAEAEGDSNDDAVPDAGGNDGSSSHADDADDSTPSVHADADRPDTTGDDEVAADEADGIDDTDDAGSKPTDSDGSDELYAVPVMLPDDTQDNADDGISFGDGRIDSMDDIARKFAAQVSESLGIQPSDDADATDDDDASDAVDDYGSDYVDLFGDATEDLPDDSDDAVDASGSKTQEDEADAEAKNAMDEMDMSDFMSDVTFDDDDETGTGAPETMAREQDTDDADGDADGGFGIDDDFPDMSDVFDDIDGSAFVDDDADVDATTASSTADGDDEGITVPARRRHGSKARWNA